MKSAFENETMLKLKTRFSWFILIVTTEGEKWEKNSVYKVWNLWKKISVKNEYSIIAKNCFSSKGCFPDLSRYAENESKCSKVSYKNFVSKIFQRN